MIQILNTILLFAELFSISIAMLVSTKTESKVIELVSLLFLMFIMRYQLENLQPII